MSGSLGATFALCPEQQSLGQAARRRDTGSSWNEANRWSLRAHSVNWVVWVGGNTSSASSGGWPPPAAELNHCLSRKSHHPLAGCFCDRLCSHLCCVPSGKDPYIFVGTSAPLIPWDRAGIERAVGSISSGHGGWLLSLTPHTSSEVCPRVADSSQPGYSRPVSLCW